MVSSSCERLAQEPVPDVNVHSSMCDDLRYAGLVEDAVSLGRLCGRSVSDDEKLVRFERPVSYSTILFFGTPMPCNPAPNALSPPAMPAPSSALIIQLTSGPNTMAGPMPGIRKNPDPNSKPDKPPQKSPS